ncbi:MAG: hypothetical protein IJI68_07965, partial [Eggerthellaceae bacterium]|nr:hypothetical protein [Eggerthellaceae bacterium]
MSERDEGRKPTPRRRTSTGRAQGASASRRRVSGASESAARSSAKRGADRVRSAPKTSAGNKRWIALAIAALAVVA